MTLEQMRAKASLIQRDIDMIIGAIDANEFPNEPVNWADLGCIDVSISLTDGLWNATVSEAAPDSRKLASHINCELQRLGHDVWVRCEW